jgi:hypothetical protein
MSVKEHLTLKNSMRIYETAVQEEHSRARVRKS